VNWKWVYLFNAVMYVVMGISNIADWRHDGTRFHLLMGAFLILLSPVWIFHWSRERRRAGL
jgi:predicted membrane metal-binding protein